jgi:hypothetical protein
MAASWKHNDGRYAPLLLKGLAPEARTEQLLARDAEGRSALYFAMDKGHVHVRIVSCLNRCCSASRVLLTHPCTHVLNKYRPWRR